MNERNFMKMKKFYVVALLLFNCLLGNSQTIQNLGSGTNGFQSQWGAIRKVYTDTVDNILYAGGSFEIAGGKTCWGIAQWNGLEWDSLGAGMKPEISTNSMVSYIRDIVRYKDEIYMTGNFRYIGGKSICGIARWNGIEWNAVGDRFKDSGNDPFAFASAMEVYNNELYVVGDFDSIGTMPSKGIAKWDGQNWTDLSQNYGANCYFDGFYTLKFFNNELYVAGNLNCPSPEEPLKKRVGDQWVEVGTGLNGDSWIAKLKVYQNNLYMGGYFFTQGGNPDNSMIYTDGVSYYPTNGGVLPAGLRDMFEYNGDLYVCGQINYAGFQPIGRIGKWNGSQWLNTNLNIQQPPETAGTASSFEKYDGKLVIAGSFSQINGTPASNIAMIDFNTVGFQLNQQNKSLKVFPNPASDVINIEINKAEQKGKVRMYNQLGKQVYQQVKGNLQSIEVADFAKGIYVVEVETDKGVLRQKVVVE